MKLHPLSAVRESGSRALAIGTTLFFAALAGAQVLGLFDVRVAAILGPLGAAVGAGYGLAYYLRYEYELGPDTLAIRSGVFGRTDREIPLGRVQNVDLRQSFLQRLLGLAVVRVETAGGGGTEAVLDFVSREEAGRIQRELRRRKGAATGADDEPAPTPLFSMSDVELGLYAVTSFRPASALVLVLAVPFGWEAATELVLAVARPLGGPTAVDPRALASAAGLVLVVVGTALAIATSWAVSFLLTLVGYHGFSLARAGDDLVYERGLLRRYSGSIPLGKVQTLTVTEHVLARRFGYAGLRVETAGYSGGGDGAGGGGSRPASAVPLAERGRALGLARSVEAFGELDFVRPPRVARRRYAVRYLAVPVALAGTLYAAGTLLGGLAYWYAPLALLPLVPVAAHAKWAHRGYHVGAEHVAFRSGFWRRRTRVVPYYRLQTVAARRTVFQRRLGLTTLVADTASAGSLLGAAPVAHDVAAEDARRLHRHLRDRLVAAVAERRSRSAYPSSSAGGV